MDVKGAKNVGMKAVLIERRPLEKVVDVKPAKVVKGLSGLLIVLEDC